jgi:hypothetical protein
MEKVTSFTAILAEAALIVWTVFLLFVAHCAHMKHAANLFRFRVLVQAVVAFLALTMLLKEPANRDPIFTKDVHELALVALLAGVFHPVHAHTLLALLVVDFVVKRGEACLDVVETHDQPPVALEAVFPHATLELLTTHTYLNY